MAAQAKIEATPLGAGQEIGRSCVLVTLGGYRVLLDCGIHTAFTDNRCFPRFELLLDGDAPGGAQDGCAGGGVGGTSSAGSLPPGGTAEGGPSKYAHCVDAVFVTHYHLDHIGALPHLVSVLGYRGPIYMTSATRAIAQTMLLDYRHVMVERKHSKAIMYTEQDVLFSLSNVRTVALHETLRLGEGQDLEVTPYYAGHVLGAVMLHLQVFLPDRMKESSIK